MELFSPSSKNKKNYSEKISYIFLKESWCYFSGNGNPEKNYYIFLKESCSYISGNGNSEKKFHIFQET